MRVTLREVERVIKSGVPLLLEGPTGTGKTYMVEEIAKKNKAELFIIDVSGELTVDTLLGQHILIDGNVVWRDGVVPMAIRKAHKAKNAMVIVEFNELNTALPEVLTVVNGLLDDQRSVTLPNADNERITAPENFRVVATQNPANGSYAGTARLNDALLNRMVKLTLDYMDFEEEVEALKKHTKLVDSTIVKLVEMARYTRRDMDSPLSTRDLVKILRLKENGNISLSDAIELVLKSRYTDNEYNLIYDYNRGIVRQLEDLNVNDEDPFENIKKRLAEVKQEEERLRKEKDDLRATVRHEMLQELLGA